MRSKKKCEDCPKIVSRNKLKLSPRTGRLICSFCKAREDKSRLRRKLRLMDYEDKDADDYATNGVKYSRVERIVNFGIRLLRGEREVLKK